MRAAVIGVATLACLAGAADADQTYSIIGAGSASCGAFLAGYDDYRRGHDQTQFFAEIQWVEGALSAINGIEQAMLAKGASAAIRKRSDLLAGVDVDAIETWLATYCQAHPLDNVSTAATALGDELIDRAKRRNQ